MSTSFRDSESYVSVMQVRNFMFEDIAKTLELRKVIGGAHGIEFDTLSNTYTFFVQKYFEEFKKAVGNYITNLENNKEGITLLEQALVNKPELL